MNRIFLSLAIVFLFYSIGCNQSTTSEQNASAESTSDSKEKTADDLRLYLQENINRYLGGQKTTEQLNTFTHHFMVAAQANEAGIDDIQIKSVLQAYTESGELDANYFVVKLIFSQGNWQREEEIHYFYKAGNWTNI